MILLDAVYVIDGGGKELLKVLINNIDNKDIKIQYLIDERLIGDNFFLERNCFFIKSSIFERYKFYKKNNTAYTKVFCFGNIPPPIFLTCPVYTYFHQKNFLKQNLFKYSYIYFILKLKFLFIKFYKNNTTYWIVQTQLMKDLLSKKLSVNKEKVLIFPFYNDNLNFCEISNSIDIKPISFLYVSNFNYHKNHENLFKAFSLLLMNFSQTNLHITISNDNVIGKRLINKYNSTGKIINHGFLNKNNLIQLYYNVDFIIFPSISESFGLPLIESALHKKILLTSDLDFVYQVVKPSFVFNPYSHESIANAMKVAINGNLKKSKLIIKNQLTEMVNLFFEKQ